VVDVLEEAVRSRLLVDEGQSYLFSHPVVRQVLLREPGTTRRQRMHLRIASRLEEMYEARLDRAILRIAHHLVRAGSAADATKVVAFAQRAAFHALASFAWHEAAELFEAALAAAAEGAVVSPRELAELHAWAGFTYDKSGDRGPCLEHLEAAIAGFRRVGDGRGLATALNIKTRARITFGMVTYRDFDDIVPLETALRELGPDDLRLRAQIMGTIALVYWTAQEPGRAAEIARGAIELARACGDDRLCAELSAALALAEFQRLELTEALETWQTGLKHARRANDLPGAIACVQRMPMALFMLGKLPEAERMVEEGRELNRTVQSHGDESLGCAIRASVCLVRGRFAEAERLAEEALNLQQRTGYAYAGIIAYVARSCGRALRGDWRQAMAAIDQIFVPGHIFEDPSGLESVFWPNRRIIDAYCGRLTRLDDELPGFVGPPPPDEGFDSSMVTAYCHQIELAGFTGRPELAAPLEDVLGFAEERGVVLSFAWPTLLARVRGVAAVLLGKREEAAEHFRRAIRLGDRLGTWPELGRARLGLADLLLSQGAASDREEAATMLREALVVLRRFGMAWFTRQAEELAARRGIRIVS
jgi:tetratricopeptide (TPR) repeat protein